MPTFPFHHHDLVPCALAVVLAETLFTYPIRHTRLCSESAILTSADLSFTYQLGAFCNIRIDFLLKCNFQERNTL